ncbi:MAG: DUF1501 domain-containing protein [Saprospiraceae bacterium]|nr:DUF1501 domain-containing protein [Saprospiraceae bacterium]
MCNEKHTDRPGKKLDHEEAHEQEHKKFSRRDFLQSAGLMATGMAAMVNGIPMYALGNTFQMMPLSMLESDRVLVLIQLRGGNDGLNTVIDRFNSEYYNIRPSLAITESNLWALDQKNGMPNAMNSLKPMWEEGKMKVIHNVGYPDPNYSHFRSSDIWATASDEDEYVSSGWIGRYFDYEFPAFQDAQPTIPPALQIGVQTDLVFQSSQRNLALAISSPNEFYKLALSGQLYDVNIDDIVPAKKELKFVRQVANSAFRYSQSIRDAYNSGRNEEAYPDNNLAQQLAIVAKLIKGNLGTKVYLVYIDGFDTHANQYDNHLRLLNRLSTSVAAFFKDLQKQGYDDKVLGMTFSEFGRTIYENGSAGTDHGTSAPMLLFTKDIGKEVVGNPPDLINTDQYGDPYFERDFRDVYATVLKNWFGMPPEVVDFVVGKDKEIMNNLIPSVQPSVGTEAFKALLGHRSVAGKPNQLEFYYSVLQQGQVIIELMDTSGQVIRTLKDEFSEKGSFTFVLDTKKYAIRNGDYIYRMKTEAGYLKEG